MVELPLYLVMRPFKRFLKDSQFCGFLLRVYPRLWLVPAGRASLVRRGVGDGNYVLRYSDILLLHDTYDTDFISVALEQRERSVG